MIDLLMIKFQTYTEASQVIFYLITADQLNLRNIKTLNS